MIARLFDIFFGCRHTSYTFPITRRPRRFAIAETYVVCLDCGVEFVYDWRTMRRGRRRWQEVTHKDHVTEARRAEDELHVAGPSRQKPLTHNVTTIERKKA